MSLVERDSQEAQQGDPVPTNPNLLLSHLHADLKGLKHDRVTVSDDDMCRVFGSGYSMIQLAPIGPLMDFYVIQPIPDSEYGPDAKRVAHYIINQEGKLVQGGAVGICPDEHKNHLKHFITPYPTLDEALHSANQILEDAGVPVYLKLPTVR